MSNTSENTPVSSDLPQEPASRAVKPPRVWPAIALGGRLLDRSCAMRWTELGASLGYLALLAPDGGYGRRGAALSSVVACLEPRSVEGAFVGARRGHSRRRRHAAARPQNGRRPVIFSACRWHDRLGPWRAGAADNVERAPHGRRVRSARPGLVAAFCWSAPKEWTAQFQFAVHSRLSPTAEQVYLEERRQQQKARGRRRIVVRREAVS